MIVINARLWSLEDRPSKVSLAEENKMLSQTLSSKTEQRLLEDLHWQRPHLRRQTQQMPWTLV